MQERGSDTTLIGMSARTLAKSVMMMQRRSKQIRSAEAKQKHSAVSIGGEMVRGSRHARSLLLHIFQFALRERASASSRGEERAQCACALGG